jgi:hypothetical protein
MSRPRPAQPKLEPYRDLVGTVADAEIAALAGCSVEDVAAYRETINKPPAPTKGRAKQKLLTLPASLPTPSAAVVVETIPLDAIAQGGVQVRASMNAATVEAYAAAMAEGADFPPVSVVRIGDDPALVLVDGFHRAAAARKIGRTSILAQVHKVATRGEAIATASAANARHGLPLSNQDKRNAVVTALRDADLCQLTGRQLAAQLGVSHELVNKIRRELGLDAGARLDDSRPWSMLAARASTDHERDSVWHIAGLGAEQLPAQVYLPIIAEAVRLRRAELGITDTPPPTLAPFRPDAPPRKPAAAPAPAPPPEPELAPWEPPVWTGEDYDRENVPVGMEPKRQPAPAPVVAQRKPQTATIAAAVELIAQALREQDDIGGADVTLMRALDVRLRQGCAQAVPRIGITEAANAATLRVKAAIHDTLAAEVPKAILAKQKKVARDGAPFQWVVEAAHAVVVEKWTRDESFRFADWRALDIFYGWSEAELFAALEDPDLRRWVARKVEAHAKETDGALVARVMLRRRPLGAARPATP